MNLLQVLQNHFIVTLSFFIIFGLIIGSFLNVVIFRYPIMLFHQWRKESIEFLKLQPNSHIQSKNINLFLPRSHCPHCKAVIPAWQNIPIVSYVFLGGKCAHCNSTISIIYPLIELLTAVLTALVIIHFGLTWQSLAALVLTWSFIILSMIDLKEKILPDNIVFFMLWLGLFLSLFHVFTTPQLAILGAIVGYLFLWIVAKSFLLIRKKDGMGHGDFKMLAMLGAWMGLMMLLNIILLAVILALITSLMLLLTKKITRENSIAFGPFLAISGWLTLMYGPFFMNAISKLISS